MLDVRWSSWPRTWGDVTMISFPMMDDGIVVGIRMKYLSVYFFFEGFRCAMKINSDLWGNWSCTMKNFSLNEMIISVVREIPMVMHHRSPVNTGTPKLDG